ncbi:MAG: LysM peptidoglycan-binding domain-containing protein [Gammaproteobacteria bacterium]|nr:LysM peptidoglycan-binding domain-containing protein [Gammaproteobacteria bacterium]
MQLAKYILIITSLFLSACSHQNTKSIVTPNANVLELPLAPIEICNTPIPDNTLVWDRIRNGFSIPVEDNPRIQQELDWYVANNGYFERVIERAQPYLHHIIQRLEAEGMPLELALLPVVESAFRPNAYSHASASGLWQFIPSTGRLYGLNQDWWYDGRRDVFASTDAALRFLKDLHARHNNDWLLALAAYNSGSGTVNRAIRRNQAAGLPIDYWSLKLPRETQAYVPKLLAVARIIHHPEQFGINLSPIPNKTLIASVPISGQLDLNRAAELAGIDVETLNILNPGFNRWATPPQGPHHLILPIELTERFCAAEALLDKNDRLRWQRHEVKSGETLGQIAQKYHSGIKAIQVANNLRGTTIRKGQELLIPMSSKEFRGAPISKTSARTVINVQKTADGKSYYIVQAGETWWRIARYMNTTIDKLTATNKLTVNDTLQTGQQLLYPEDANIADSNQGTRKLEAQQNQTQTVHYKVRSGDSLYKIASRFSVSVANIRLWNALTRNAPIKPGQRLKLYVDIRRDSASNG